MSATFKGWTDEEVEDFFRSQSLTKAVNNQSVEYSALRAANIAAQNAPLVEKIEETKKEIGDVKDTIKQQVAPDIGDYKIISVMLQPYFKKLNIEQEIRAELEADKIANKASKLPMEFWREYVVNLTDNQVAEIMYNFKDILLPKYTGKVEDSCTPTIKKDGTMSLFDCKVTFDPITKQQTGLVLTIETKYPNHGNSFQPFLTHKFSLSSKGFILDFVFTPEQQQGIWSTYTTKDRLEDFVFAINESGFVPVDQNGVLNPKAAYAEATSGKSIKPKPIQPYIMTKQGPNIILKQFDSIYRILEPFSKNKNDLVKKIIKFQRKNGTKAITLFINELVKDFKIGEILANVFFNYTNKELVDFIPAFSKKLAATTSFLMFKGRDKSNFEFLFMNERWKGIGTKASFGLQNIVDQSVSFDIDSASLYRVLVTPESDQNYSSYLQALTSADLDTLYDVAVKLKYNDKNRLTKYLIKNRGLPPKPPPLPTKTPTQTPPNQGTQQQQQQQQPPQGNGMKRGKGGNIPAYSPMRYVSASKGEMAKRIQILIGSLRNGNDNPLIRQELGALADEMYKRKYLTKVGYRKLMKMM